MARRDESGRGGRSRDSARSGRERRGGVRLFVAAYPPRELVDLLQDHLRTIELPPHRMTPAEQVHLTLHFIGETPESEVESKLESVERSCAGVGPGRLSIRRLITLPRRGPARLVAAEGEATHPVLELHDRLVKRLAENPAARPRDRYLPHLTLCRFRGPTRIHLGSDGEIEGPADGPLDFPIDEIALMRSRLLPTGAVHERVAAFRL